MGSGTFVFDLRAQGNGDGGKHDLVFDADKWSALGNEEVVSNLGRKGLITQGANYCPRVCVRFNVGRIQDWSSPVCGPMQLE